MRYIYNGIDLMPLDTYECNIESVYEETGTDYLYSQVSVLTRAVVNGQAEIVLGIAPNGPFMSYAFDPNSSVDLTAGDPTKGVRKAPTLVNGPFVPPNTGIDAALKSTLKGILRIPNAPLLTHQVIRHRLSTPQGKFFIFSGPGMEAGAPPAGEFGPPVTTPGTNNQVIINVESPVGVAPCDCKNGPFPKLFGIHSALGDANTLLVDWGCVTYINDSQVNGVNPRGPLLSNRFSQSHSVNDAGYTQITTTGTALFRMDEVYRLGVSPDFSRPIIFMPILPGFTRVIDYVRGRPDGTGIEYSYIDTQQAAFFVAGPYVKAAKISMVHRQAITSNADLLGGALGAYQQVLGLKANRNFASQDKDEEGSAKKAMRTLARMIGREVRKAAPGGAIKPKGD